MESLLLDQLSCLSHPQRMAIFRLLMRRCPDALPAGEIAQTLGLKPSTSSVYLSALTQCGLLAQSRQGTSLRYRLDLEAAQGMVGALFVDCCRGRPDLCPPHLATAAPRAPFTVLFLCSRNTARSILAEAILRHEAGGRFTAYSAGIKPATAVNAEARAMLEARGLPVQGLRSKHISEFQAADAPRMDFVFTVCDLAANEDCPAWPGQPVSGHWGLPDPVRATGTEAERRLAFQQSFGALTNRIRAFAALPFEALDRAALQRRVDDLATLEA
jgi:protein-tyrosine-phosphatase